MTEETATEILVGIGKTIAETIPEKWGFCLLMFENPGGNNGAYFISTEPKDGVLPLLEEYLKKMKERELTVSHTGPKTASPH